MPLPLNETDIIKTLSELTTQLALTNQNLSWMGDELRSHSKIFFGDEQAKGGMILTVSQLGETQKLQGEYIATIQSQLSQFSIDCALITGTAKAHADSIRNLNRLALIYAIALGIILFVVGIADFKTLITIFAGLL